MTLLEKTNKQTNKNYSFKHITSFVAKSILNY